VFVYDASSKLIAEYSNQTPQNPNTSYVATDTLLSVRLVTDRNGNVVSRRDFQPFGEELPADGSARKTTDNYSTSTEDKVRQRFTGYQKDIETGLDFAEARMYENRHGRFTAVDPLLASGKSANPQTFNRYTYVLNSSLVNTDPTGLQTNSTGSILDDAVIYVKAIPAYITKWVSETFCYQGDCVRSKSERLVRNPAVDGLSGSDPLQNANFQRFQNTMNATLGDGEAANRLNDRLIGNQGRQSRMFLIKQTGITRQLKQLERLVLSCRD